MATAAFPDFADANIFKTENVTVETEPELYLTLTAQVDGNERNLTFASTTEANRIIVDWGDGKRVASEVIAMADEYGTTTTVTGTPAGEGHIKIYAREISVFGCDSRVDGAQVTAINTSAATDLRELNVYTNALKTLDLSQNANLEKLNCYNNSLEELDLTGNKKLTRLDAKDTPLAKIDLSQNTELDYLSLNNCPIEAIDLSNNTKLSSLYLLNCKLADIDLSKNTALTYVNLNNNQLTSLDVTASEALGTLFCMGNQLTELKADNVTKSVNCSKNNFTLATLPALPCKTYTYAPQNAMQIAAEVKAGETVDLSAQDNISGLLDCKVKTTYTWLTEDGEALVAGTDYTERGGRVHVLGETRRARVLRNDHRRIPEIQRFKYVQDHNHTRRRRKQHRRHTPQCSCHYGHTWQRPDNGTGKRLRCEGLQSVRTDHCRTDFNRKCRKLQSRTGLVYCKSKSHFM